MNKRVFVCWIFLFLIFEPTFSQIQSSNPINLNNTTTKDETNNEGAISNFYKSLMSTTTESTTPVLNILSGAARLVDPTDDYELEEFEQKKLSIRSDFLLYILEKLEMFEEFFSPQKSVSSGKNATDSLLETTELISYQKPRTGYRHPQKILSACHDASLKITCPGLTTIDIQSAVLISNFHGLDSCSRDLTEKGSCRTIDVFKLLSEKCNKKKECEINVSDYPVHSCPYSELNLQTSFVCEWYSSIGQETFPRVGDIFWIWGDPYFHDKSCEIVQFITYTLSSIFTASFIVEWLRFEYLTPHKRIYTYLLVVACLSVVFSGIYALSVSICPVEVRQRMSYPRKIWNWVIVTILLLFVSILFRPRRPARYVLKYGPEMMQNPMKELIVLENNKIDIIDTERMWNEFVGDFVPKTLFQNRPHIRRREAVALFPSIEKGVAPGQMYYHFQKARRVLQWARDQAVRLNPGEKFPSPETRFVGEAEIAFAKKIVLIQWMRAVGHIIIDPEIDPPELRQLSVTEVLKLMKKLLTTRATISSTLSHFLVATTLISFSSLLLEQQKTNE